MYVCTSRTSQSTPLLIINFCHLNQVPCARSSVRRSIPRRALLTLIQALVVSFSRCVWCPPKTVAVCIECCRTAGILGQEVRTHHSVTPWTPLVEISGEDKVSALCPGFPISSWYSRLWSAAMSTLIIPATLRRTLGGRAFPVAAACAWNSLSSFVRDKQSPAGFRQQLKTVLFRTSFSEDAYAWAASLLTRDSFVFVRWSCNVLTW